MKNKKSSKEPVAIRDLYPDLNNDQLKEAEENLARYLGLTLRIYDRIRQDQEEYARFKTLMGYAADRYDGVGQRSKKI